MEITLNNSSLALMPTDYDNGTSCDAFYLKSVDKCWLYIIWTVITISGVVVSLPANSVIFWVLKQTKDRDPCSFYIFNMAIMDLLFCLGSFISFTNYYSLYNNAARWVVRFIAVLNMVGSPLFLCVLCVERYLAVVWATSYARFRGLKYKMGCCAIIWLIVMTGGIGQMIKENTFFDTYNVYAYFLVLLFAVMIFCSLSILKVLKKSVPGVDKIHPLKEKASRTISIILIFMIVMYFPSVVVLPFRYYYPNHLYDYYLMPGCLSISTASSSIHSLLYLYILDKLPLRGKLWEMRCCCARY